MPNEHELPSSMSTDPEIGAGGAEQPASRVVSGVAVAEPPTIEERAAPLDDRARVLRMVADGKITVDEAVELLNALGSPPVSHQGGASQAEASGVMPQDVLFGHAPQFPWQHDKVFFQRHVPGPFGPGGPMGHGGPHVGPFGHRGPFEHGRPGPMRWTVPLPQGAVPAPPPGAPVPPMPPIPPVPPMPGLSHRVLVFDVRDGDKRYNARLPGGLVGDVNRFLPRQVRQALEELEVDVSQLIDLFSTMREDHGGNLLDIQHDERRVTVQVEWA